MWHGRNTWGEAMSVAFNVGDSVRISDGSEAHGERGTIWAIQDNGITLVELEIGILWPIESEHIKKI